MTGRLAGDGLGRCAGGRVGVTADDEAFVRRDEFVYDDRGIVEHRVTFTARPPPHDMPPTAASGKSAIRIRPTGWSKKVRPLRLKAQIFACPHLQMPERV